MPTPPGNSGPPKAPPRGEEWTTGESNLLRALFLDEAEKHLARILDAQKALARASEASLEVAPEVIDGLFRHLHTLKGSAGSVGFEAIAKSAHELEELCAEIRKGQLAPTFGILERIDDGIAEIKALLASARLVVPITRGHDPPEGPPPSSMPSERRRATDRRAVAERRSGAEGVLRVEVERLDAMLSGIGDMVILGTRLDRRAHEGDSVHHDLLASLKALREVDKDLAGLLPTLGARAELGRILDRLGEVEVKFTDSISYLERTARTLFTDARSLRSAAITLEEQLRRARLVPLEWGFSRLGSALHELERSCHRQAELQVQGGDIELDKSLVDQLVDPLNHLLRNAMAHGIEDAKTRLSLGKPAHGKITINAVQEPGFVNLTFEDDGAGIDRTAIQQILKTQGHADTDAVGDKLLNTIFEAGFSTRKQSDALAGRGMGLNIVKRALMRIGGELKVESEPGKGTRFRMIIPVGGAITQGLLFKLGGQVYAVPAAHVVQILPVGHNLLAGTARSTAQSGEIPMLAGTSLPVLMLHALLGAELPPGRQAAALHVRYAGRHFLLTCDRVIGPRTIVVRPPGPLLGLIPLYAGVTASGAGKAQLVLDLGTLSEYLDRPHLPPSPPRRGQPRVLVVDFSRLAREAAARLLGAAGYQAVTAEDGYEAWEMLSERRFDVVVTSLEMPRVDGFQLIARIRRENTLAGLPILVLSSRTSHATRERAIKAGANAFLPKSRHRKSLVEAVASCLAARQSPGP